MRFSSETLCLLTKFHRRTFSNSVGRSRQTLLDDDKMSERRPGKGEFWQKRLNTDWRRTASAMLLACHVETSDRLHLLCLLRQSAAVTAAEHAQVAQEAAFNSFLFTHLQTNTNNTRVVHLQPVEQEDQLLLRKPIVQHCLEQPCNILTTAISDAEKFWRCACSQYMF